MASTDKIQLDRLSYVIYAHQDRNAFLTFAADFGFEQAGDPGDGDLFFRGYGLDPYVYVYQQAPAGQPKRFVGSGFRARTRADFEKAKTLEGAKEVDISHRPGGGKLVSLQDVNGFELQIVYGQEERQVPPKGLSNVLVGDPNVNGALAKARKGIFNRMGSGPAKIHKLGHFGYMTDNYRATCDWYSSRFNFKATDIVHRPGDPKAQFMSFFRLDLGQEYSDHHCLLVAEHHGDNKGTTVHHSSFEVEDLDTQMMGHEWLLEKKYKPMWGVGRHIMGSQIFDYWYDSSGFIIEHYADSDVVNEDVDTIHSAGTAASIWGPPMPVKWK